MLFEKLRSPNKKMHLAKAASILGMVSFHSESLAGPKTCDIIKSGNWVKLEIN